VKAEIIFTVKSGGINGNQEKGRKKRARSSPKKREMRGEGVTVNQGEVAFRYKAWGRAHPIEGKEGKGGYDSLRWRSLSAVLGHYRNGYPCLRHRKGEGNRYLTAKPIRKGHRHRVEGGEEGTPARQPNRKRLNAGGDSANLKKKVLSTNVL